MYTYTRKFAYIHAQVCVHTCASLHTYTGKFAYIHAQVCVHTRASLHTYTGKFAYIHAQVCTCCILAIYQMCMLVYACTRARVYSKLISSCVHMHIHTCIHVCICATHQLLLQLRCLLLSLPAWRGLFRVPPVRSNRWCYIKQEHILLCMYVCHTYRPLARVSNLHVASVKSDSWNVCMMCKELESCVNVLCAKVEEMRTRWVKKLHECVNYVLSKGLMRTWMMW